ncbi:LPXTG cell wall anchor domain-containing protein [Brevibacterium luteolum]|uniref:LPXTG cell wall anchor domain-containing protein n=1 Tax=Brevibacterium luteolum TaxID=199591 RepID=UPI003EEF6638
MTAVSESSVEDLEAAGTITITALIAADGGVKRGEKNFEITIEKQDDGDDAPAFDPKVSSAPDEITAADLANPDKGISITASNLQPGDVVTNSLTNEPETSEGDELVTGVYYEGDPSDFEVGDKVDFTVTVTREGEESKTFDFTVTIIGEDDGDDEKWEPELKVAPKKISVTDFRNENKGVKLELTGCYPGEIATFIIEQYEGDLSYETEVETDEHGTAVIEHIHGTGNAPDSAYIGEYHVIASCIDGEEEAYGDFSVHAGDDSKGGGDSDKGRDRDRNELPRTGSDLTALYGAAGLLAVGAAAMAVGRRKSTKK